MGRCWSLDGRLFSQLKLACAAAMMTASIYLSSSSTFGAPLDATVEGLWANNPQECIERTPNSLLVKNSGMDQIEDICVFTGGARVNPQHWLLKGKCSAAGEYEDGREPPEQLIELKVLNGALQVTARGEQTYWAVKCPEFPSGDVRGSQRTLWNHNGSTMYLVAEGDRRQFFYHNPRQGIIEAGARPDSLLFEGRAVGNAYVGTAFIYNKRCGQAPYSVSGPVLDGGRRVVMRGLAPRINRQCKVFGYKDDVLEFTLVPWQ
jgi:hypothetical protein